MSRIRKFVAYRRMDRPPYTRYSKYKKLSYVRSRPVCRVVRFDMGDCRKNYDVVLNLVSEVDVQVRDNAIESARQTSVRLLESTLGKMVFFLQVRIYPHHVLRENSLASGAGADRMSTGMAHSYGKNIGIAARVFKGKPLFTVHCFRSAENTARQALKLASHKLPCKCRILEEAAKVKKK